jgi:hypothetical protein
MLKFIAGAVVGWTSARLLPPPSSMDDRLKPPTSEELLVIVQKTQAFLMEIKTKIEEES